MQSSTPEKNILNKKIGLISLGCDKNRVDLENIISLIKNAGFKTTQNLYDANVIVINTCSFIESARKESVETILNIAKLKETSCEKIIVTGCLNEMNYSDLKSSLPEVDSFIRVSENKNIVKTIFELYNITPPTIKYNCNFNRVLTTPNHYAYLKISEGCNNFCSYCTIPFIRGRFVSTPMEQLISEAKELAKLGVKELILVGQDVTKYGVDLYGKPTITTLIQKLSEIEDIKWIRLLYCYPELVSDELINEIKNNNKVLKYIDLPLQHVNSNILKQMNRKTDGAKVLEVVHKLKQNIPNIAIRSTFILGFPGETTENFNEVLTFLKNEKLNNVGFFAYSREEGTRAYSFDNQVSTRTKQSRVEKAYATQKIIAENNNLSLVNKVLDVIIDEEEDGYFIGRSYLSAPDVDPVVFIKITKENKDKIKIGNIVPIKISSTLEYDLEGELYYESTK